MRVATQTSIGSARWILSVPALALFLLCASTGYFQRDPKAVYDDRTPGLDLVVRIPGQALDPASALQLEIGEKEFAAARTLDTDIVNKVIRYNVHRRFSASENVTLYAVKESGDYLLLFFREPDVMDGGFELVYSKKLGKIIGRFTAGHRG
ncbi:hypothetical protein JW777_00830 [bacterium]|nr:hypothetical protein [bacterium]